MLYLLYHDWEDDYLHSYLNVNMQKDNIIVQLNDTKNGNKCFD